MMHCTEVQIEADRVVTHAQHLPHLRRKYVGFSFFLLFLNVCQLIKDVSDTFVPLIFQSEREKQYSERLVTVR